LVLAQHSLIRLFEDVDVYSKEYGVKVNYQASARWRDIEQLTNKTVDFARSDAIMSEAD